MLSDSLSALARRQVVLPTAGALAVAYLLLALVKRGHKYREFDAIPKYKTYIVPILSLFYGIPQLQALVEMAQDPKYHPFGKVDIFGKRVLYINDVKALREAFVPGQRHYQPGHSMERSHAFSAITDNMTNGPNVLSARGDEWKWRRKALVPYFQPRAVIPAIFPHLKDLAARNADAMLALADGGNTMDVDKETGLLTLDVICLYLFGYPTSELDVSDLGEGGARNMSSLLLKLQGESQAPQLLLPVIKNTKWAQRNVDAVRGKLQSFIDKAMEKSTQMSAADIERLGFTPITHNLRQQGGYLDSDTLNKELIMLMQAGHDTTAHTFAFLLGHLAHDPNLQESLADEIHRAFGPSPIDWSKLCISDFNQLKFATCVIRENLRLHAVAPGGLLTCVKDTVIAGIPIPAGTDLIGNYYGIARDPQYFPDPEAFQPERWATYEESVFQELTGDVSDMTTNVEAALPELSFALGAHACLGRNLALIEMRVLLAMIIERVVIRPSANTTLEAIWVLLVTPKNGMDLSFSARHE